MSDASQFAMVTGAGSGIGRAIAIALMRHSIHVTLVGRDTAKLTRTAAGAPADRATIVAADLATEGGIAAAASNAARLHILVHAAGQYLQTPTTQMTAEAWSALDSVNLHAPILLTNACLPQLRASSGQVVFINSSASLRGGPNIAAYAAGKRGLQAAVEILRQEINRDGIRVLSIYPGRTDTPMQQAILASEGRTAEPGQLMQPDDIAAMVLAALQLSRHSEVTDIFMRPMRPL